MTFENRFANRAAVITGGASGIGEAVARRISAEGGKVILFDMDQANLDRVAAACGGAATMRVDVADESAVHAAVDQAAAVYGSLDILVHCAGIVGQTSTPILDYNTETFERVMRVNLFSAFYLTKAVLPHMIKHNYGRILMLASISGKEGNPGMIGYSTSKAGLIGFVKAIGKEYATTGITVNALAPAVIRTPMNENTSPEQLQYMLERIPMKRLGSADEAASIACWIVSEEASFNTAAVFDLTGGRATY